LFHCKIGIVGTRVMTGDPLARLLNTSIQNRLTIRFAFDMEGGRLDFGMAYGFLFFLGDMEFC
jgi:hypothetical protein